MLLNKESQNGATCKFENGFYLFDFLLECKNYILIQFFFTWLVF